MASTTQDASMQAPPKKMRKGTHSCQACRSRKCRCIFDPDQLTCRECLTRGLKCVDQQSGMTKSESECKRAEKERHDAEVAVLVTELLRKLDLKREKASCTKSEIAAHEALRKVHADLQLGADAQPSTRSDVKDDVGDQPDLLPRESPSFPLPQAYIPLISIVNQHSDSLSFGEDEVPPHRDLYPKNGQVEVETRVGGVSMLNELLPSPADIAVILEAGSMGWKIWQKAFPNAAWTELDATGSPVAAALFGFILQQEQSTNVAIIIKLLLCLLLQLQQLPANFNWARINIPGSMKNLETQYLDPISKVLQSDNKDTSSIDGLRCMMLQARWYINSGKLHRAWLIHRHAVGLAQLLGLHQPSRLPKSSENIQVNALWLEIWQSELYLSVLLGLPYSVSQSHFDVERYAHEIKAKSWTEQLLFQVGITAGRIVDRNQKPHASQFSTTVQLDQDLEDCRNQIPQDWWDFWKNDEASHDTASEAYSAQFAFHNVRKLIHLPYMLQATTDVRYRYSKLAVLDSSRNMIKIYHAMRAAGIPLFQICNMADYQVFTAALILILNNLSPEDRDDNRAHTEDWNLVNKLIQLLKRVASESSVNVAVQAVRILEAVSDPLSVSPEDAGSTSKIPIPYFGEVTIRRKLASNQETIGDSQTQAPLDATANGAGTFESTSDESFVSFNTHFSQNDPHQGPPSPYFPWDLGPDFDLCDDWTSSVAGFSFQQ